MSAHAEQVSHYRAVRARLFANKVKTPKQVEHTAKLRLMVLRDFDAHILAWRKWCAFKEALRASSTSATVCGSFGEYVGAAPLSLEDNSDSMIFRRSMKDICLDVLQKFPGVSLEEVKGVTRNRGIVKARFACMYAVRQERADLSFPAIGRFFGGRDHTTVLHAVKKIKAQREKEQEQA